MKYATAAVLGLLGLMIFLQSASVANDVRTPLAVVAFFAFMCTILFVPWRKDQKHYTKRERDTASLAGVLVGVLVLVISTEMIFSPDASCAGPGSPLLRDLCGLLRKLDAPMGLPVAATTISLLGLGLTS